jgi:hypothetical protein
MRKVRTVLAVDVNADVSSASRLHLLDNSTDLSKKERVTYLTIASFLNSLTIYSLDNDCSTDIGLKVDCICC